MNTSWGDQARELMRIKESPNRDINLGRSLDVGTRLREGGASKANIISYALDKRNKGPQ
jgi:hypothetical protein